MELSADRHNGEMQGTKPPFRADQVGSLFRVPVLR